MKKTCLFFMLIFMSFMSINFVHATEDETTILSNPNPQYCQTTNVDGVYKCTKSYFAFDTSISFSVYVDERSTFDIINVFDEVENIIKQYDMLLDPYEDHEGINNVYNINETEGPIVIDQKLFDAIAYTLDNQDVNPEGDLLFNIALEPILKIWHDARYSDDCIQGIFYDRCPIPSEDLLNQTYPTNPEDVILDEDNLTIDFQASGMGIDLGGAAKGYVSMIIEEHLSQYDFSYILNLGASNVLVHGDNISNPNANHYTIGLTKPTFESLNTSYYGAVKVESTYSVVSSGSYQRYFKSLLDEDNDTIYHHIIDPRTRMPGGDALAVTILTNDTGVSDILSTAIYLMDYEDALDYVNSQDNLEAVWYFAEDDIRMSENADQYIILYNQPEPNNPIFLIGGIAIVVMLGVFGGFYYRKRKQVQDQETK